MRSTGLCSRRDTGVPGDFVPKAWAVCPGILYHRFKVLRASLYFAQMIDEVHTLIGAGAAEGAIDAANILKPALARGELQCIGATTLDEYRKHIEKDPALERRFQPVKICPISSQKAPAFIVLTRAA